MMRQEFLHVMQERFMSGNDLDFDYRSVPRVSDGLSLWSVCKSCLCGCLGRSMTVLSTTMSDR